MYSLEVAEHLKIITAFLLMGSVQLMTIGIMGESIGRIYDEVKGRPHYLIKESSLVREYETSRRLPDIRTRTLTSEQT